MLHNLLFHPVVIDLSFPRVRPATMEVEEATFDIFSTSRSRLLPVDAENASLFNSHSVGMLQWGSMEDFAAFNKRWESVDDVRQIASDFTAPPSHPGSVDRLQLLGRDHPEVQNGHPDTYSQSGTLPIWPGDDSNEAVFEVVVDMKPGERRFGFSVMGGLDEGFPPRIDDIAPGKFQGFGRNRIKAYGMFTSFKSVLTLTFMLWVKDN